MGSLQVLAKGEGLDVGEEDLFGLSVGRSEGGSETEKGEDDGQEGLWQIHGAGLMSTGNLRRRKAAHRMI